MAAGNLSFVQNNSLTLDGAQFPVETTISYMTLVRVGATIAANTDPQEVLAAFKYAKIVAYLLWMDRAGTIKTNSSGSPAETITMTAATSKIFRTGNGTSEFGTDVTTLYATQSSGSATASFKAWIFLEM